MAALSTGMRAFVRGVLLATAILCLVFTTASVLATMAAGTLQMDGGYPTGPGYLSLSSLSVVRFQGLIPSDGTDSPGYQLTLYWFLNAFGWEWPNTEWEHSCGIVNNINGLAPGPALTLPEDLALVARGLRLPETDYACLDEYHHRQGICYNDFLASWAEVNPPTTSFSTVVPLFGYYFASVLLMAIAISETLVRRFPNLAKCYCPEFISKRKWCSCLKEGEEMTAAVRNRLRVYNIGMLIAAYIFSFSMMMSKAFALLAYVKDVGTQVAGMDAQLGMGFVCLSAGTLVAMLVSMVCLLVRARIGEGKSWMEEQSVKLDATKDGEREHSRGEEADAPLP